MARVHAQVRRPHFVQRHHRHAETMPFGTPERSRPTCAATCELAGPRGGLFCCPTHMLEPEVPWANIEAYVEAVREFHPVG